MPDVILGNLAEKASNMLGVVDHFDVPLADNEQQTYHTSMVAEFEKHFSAEPQAKEVVFFNKEFE